MTRSIIPDFPKWTALCALLMFRSAIFSPAQNPVDAFVLRLEGLEGIEKARVLNDAVYFYAKSDRSRVQEYVDQSIALAASDDDPAIRAYALLSKGVYFNSVGTADSAAYYIEHARELAGGEVPLLIRTGVALGRVYIGSGKAEQGLEILLGSLRLMEQYPDEEADLKARSNISWAYLELKRYTDCIYFGRRSMLRITAATEWIAPYFCNNIAASYGALNNLDSTAHFAKQGIALATKYQDLGVLANAYFILGNSYSNAGRYNDALAQFRLAREIRTKTGNVFYEVADLYVISDLYHKIGNFKEGIAAGEEGLRIARENNLTLKFEGVYQVLAKNYEALGDFRNAATFYRLLAASKDSVYQDANATAMAEMQTRYETEKKELQLARQELKLVQSQRLIASLVGIVILILLLILIWRRNVTHRQKAIMLRKEKEHQVMLTEAVIALQDQERARFARDLHDGMGQLISSVRMHLHKASDPTVSHILDHMHDEIRNIAFSLLPYTLVNDGLPAALRELASRTGLTQKLNFHLTAHDYGERLDPRLEVSLYRICQEWINNVMKYGDAGNIYINVIRHEATLSMTLEDDGNGFDPALLKSSPGNGWRNIQSRTQVHQGTVMLETKPGVRGSILLIEIPLLLRTETKVA